MFMVVMFFFFLNKIPNVYKQLIFSASVLQLLHVYFEPGNENRTAQRWMWCCQGKGGWSVALAPNRISGDTAAQVSFPGRADVLEYLSPWLGTLCFVRPLNATPRQG